jgi:hypothetical protein
VHIYIDEAGETEAYMREVNKGKETKRQGRKHGRKERNQEGKKLLKAMEGEGITATDHGDGR